MKDNALYLEVDEDITSAIDKLSKMPAGPVQIVVPKRSTMLQSIINLKLLKKAADQTGKELALVTGDRIASELAARVGLAVASAIGAEAVMSRPSMPEALQHSEEVIDDDDDVPINAASAASQTPARPSVPKKPLLRRMPVSDGPPPEAAAVVPSLSANDGPASVPSARKAVSVPNFSRLQRRLLWAGLGVFLIAGYWAAMYFLTSAKVTLYAAGTRVGIDTSFAVDTAATASDSAKSVLAAQTVTVTKDLSGPFTPSGKKDVGTKAGGTVTIQNCEDSNTYPLAAGNALVSQQGLTFTTNEAITIPAGTFTNGGKNCTTPTVSVGVTASANGDKFNLTNATFSSPKLTANFKVLGAQMTGGTTKTVNIVTKSDVDTEKANLLDKDKDNSVRDLAGKLPSGYMAIESSQATSAEASPSPAIDAEGETGTLALKVTYTVLAVKKSDYTQVLHAQEQKQVGDSNQIYDDGLGAAQITSSGKDSAGRPAFHLTTDAYSGAKIDKVALAKKIAGQRFGDARTAATGLPGVSRAEIAITPGWVSKLPTRPDKISITIQVASNK